MREEKLIYKIKGNKSMIILGVIFKGYVETIKSGWFKIINRVQYLVPIDKIREFDEIYKEMSEK